MYKFVQIDAHIDGHHCQKTHNNNYKYYLWLIVVAMATIVMIDYYLKASIIGSDIFW